VPRVEWTELIGRLRRRFKQGDHVTLLGPTRSGKTTLSIELAELRRYVIFLASKKNDPVISGLRRRGYHVTTNLDELPWTQDGPVYERLVYWPTFKADVPIAERIRLQRPAMRKALDFVDRTGKWALVVDELVWFEKNLRLRAELESIWFQGATEGISLIGSAQRPAWVSRFAYSSASLVAIWQTNDRDDLRRLSDLAAGIDVELVRHTVANLDWNAHEFLLIDTRERTLVRSIAPPPKR
jgi:hypothetical protein